MAEHFEQYASIINMHCILSLWKRLTNRLHTITGYIITGGAAADSTGTSSSSVQLSQQHDVHPTSPPSTAAAGRTTAAVQAASSGSKDQEFNIIGYKSAVNEAQRKEDELYKALDKYREEELMERLENEAPFKLGLYDKSRCFNHEALIQLFAEVAVLPEFCAGTAYAEEDTLQSCAVQVATEVYNSNTAEQLAYTIQQLMFTEHDQKYQRTISWPVDKMNPTNTTFSDLEAWATQGSDGTVTIDIDKLGAACEYIEEQLYSRRGYQWARTLQQLDYYFRQDEQHRVKQVLHCSTLGITLIMLYVEGCRLEQLRRLPSLWDYSTQHVVTRDPDLLHTADNVHCCAAIDGATLIVEAAVASLTVRYCEAARQQLITQLLVLKWLAAAVLSRGILPATSLQVLGHIVLDCQPGAHLSTTFPVLTTEMVPDHEDIPITVHNLYFTFG
jgi:hypothetical protein